MSQPGCITIVGLGPGSADLLTLQASKRLAEANEVYLRTQRHPTVAALPADLTRHSFDTLYESLPSFQAVYETIAAEVVRLGQRPQGVLYAVPGHPLVGEATTQHILTLAAQANVPVEVIDGLSFIEPTLSALKQDPLDGLQIVDAQIVAAQHHPPLSADRPALLGQLYNREIAAEVKLTLMNLYPDEHPVTLVRAAGAAGAVVRTLPLYELDRQPDMDHLTSLYLPPLPAPSAYETLQEVVAHLRAPDGCPWDRKQTHHSLRDGLLEETYEVLEAIDTDDTDKLCEELGDLLLQVGLQTQIAVEDGEFMPGDVINGIVTKLWRRHPHVFDHLSVGGVDEVLHNWEAIKQQERTERGQADADQATAALNGVPRALPALARAQALIARAARLDYDQDAPLPASLAQLETELQNQDPVDGEPILGDVLLALVGLAQRVEIDAESALRLATERFIQRFAARSSG
ncbi:MAG: nucleoside triphosphate pyrophosphohydrolase [Chloroflexota bacterium]